METTKQCSKCKAHKPREEFYVDLSRRTGLTASCKVCNDAARNERRHRVALARAVAKAQNRAANPVAREVAGLAGALREALAARGVQ
ncbi:hypothetical protein [Paraburkholderia sp. J76]|uniref:hypothetical protein n=1 Tax=Paraburkholderia sp. J76 TaxID=2805439 RepID=UPI002ABDD422|nr:hypothetical protein [Paraburkholderia sp. J76]